MRTVIVSDVRPTSTSVNGTTDHLNPIKCLSNRLNNGIHLAFDLFSSFAINLLLTDLQTKDKTSLF